MINGLNLFFLHLIALSSCLTPLLSCLRLNLIHSSSLLLQLQQLHQCDAWFRMCIVLPFKHKCVFSSTLYECTLCTVTGGLWTKSSFKYQKSVRYWCQPEKGLIRGWATWMTGGDTVFHHHTIHVLNKCMMKMSFYVWTKYVSARKERQCTSNSYLLKFVPAPR